MLKRAAACCLCGQKAGAKHTSVALVSFGGGDPEGREGSTVMIRGSQGEVGYPGMACTGAVVLSTMLEISMPKTVQLIEE